MAGSSGWVAMRLTVRGEEVQAMMGCVFVKGEKAARLANDFA